MSEKTNFKDVVCVFVLREDNEEADKRKCLLRKSDSRGWWLPYVELSDAGEESWEKSIASLSKELFGDKMDCSNEAKLISLKRYLFKSTPSCTCVATFFIRFPNAHDINANETVRWVSIEELSIGCQAIDLIGPEPPNLFKHLDASLTHTLYEEQSYNKTNNSPALHLLLQSAKYSATDQYHCYMAFMKAAFPTDVLNEMTFRPIGEALGCSQRFISPLFRAFDSRQKSYLNFKDFLNGLAIMEAHTVHGGSPGEARCRFIFRFYDSDSDGLLTFADFKRMIVDVNALRKVDETSGEPQILTAEDIYTNVFGVKSITDSLSLNQFLETVGFLKFRGTSALLRLKSPLEKFLKHAQIEISDVSTASPSTKRIRKGRDDEVGATEPECPNYELATHTVKLKYSGRLVDCQPLWDLEGTAAVNTELRFNEIAKIQRFPSVDSFNRLTPQSRLLMALKQWMNEAKGASDSTYWEGWGCMPAKDIGQCLLTVCAEASKIMKNEPRLLKLSSPAYILGDLHGSYRDLMCFEKAFWRFGTILAPAKLLFLGDYVDRGDFGVEVVAYLLAQKLLASNNVFLLRGNHEVRDIQKSNSFHVECRFKFGVQFGEKVWESINQCFDTMPLAGVVDSRVFCVHGGIFSPQYGDGLIETINRIPVPLRDPIQCAIAWDLMWNDPAEESTSQMDEDNGTDKAFGFFPNISRNTGKWFTTKALEAFLQRNGLSHVVRAHQVKMAGFQFQQHGKLLTVFSSSSLHRPNEIACVLADRSKLRVLVIDTD